MSIVWNDWSAEDNCPLSIHLFCRFRSSRHGGHWPVWVDGDAPFYHGIVAFFHPPSFLPCAFTSPVFCMALLHWIYLCSLHHQGMGPVRSLRPQTPLDVWQRRGSLTASLYLVETFFCLLVLYRPRSETLPVCQKRQGGHQAFLSPEENNALVSWDLDIHKGKLQLQVQI